MPANLPLGDPRGGAPVPHSDNAESALHSLRSTLGATLRAALQPAPILPPDVDPDLAELTVAERIAEVLRYKILQLEYSLANGGGLRAVLKLSLLLGLLIGIPTLLVVPVVTLLLSSFATLSGFLFHTALNWLYATLALAASAVVLIALHYGVRQYAASARRR